MAEAFNRGYAQILLIAACKSGDEGTIRLAAQLSGAAPCERCDYIRFACRCPSSATGGVAPSGKGGA